MLNTSDIDESTLRANYGKTSDDEIVRLLERIHIVEKTHKGEGTVFGYYTLQPIKLDEIKRKPRNISHTFSFEPHEPVKGLKQFKTIAFLVKSSSRLFLKADIGEVFDQMDDNDKRVTKAIHTITENAFNINSPSGNEFVCTAVLLQ